MKAIGTLRKLQCGTCACYNGGCRCEACTAAIRAYNKKRRLEKPEYARELSRKSRRKRAQRPLRVRKNEWLRWRYGITVDDFERMFFEQNENCAICARPFENESAASVDHDHTTGAVRGLLCDNCNRAIGMLKEDVAVLQAAVEYLKKHGAVFP